jgi:surface protein
MAVLLPSLHVNPTSAQLGQDVAVSWVAQIPSTPVPSLGSFGAWFLAILVALLIRRAIGTKPNRMGSLALTGVLSCSVIGVIWTTQVLSNGSPTVVTIPTDAECSDTHIFSNAEQVTLVNNCSDPVRVFYSVTGTSNCALQELSCAGSACAGDGELVPANGGQAEVLGCYATAPTVSLSCADSSLAEDGGTLVCSLTLSRTWSQSIDVNVAYSGTATAGTDYTGDTAAHTITAGNTSTSWSITGVSDGDNAESDEEIVIEITTVTNGTENGAQSLTIAMPYACIPPGQAIANNTDFDSAISDWFTNSGALYGDITQWCTAAVTDMSSTFSDQTSFNEAIGGWDTSNVTNMERTFLNASAFNQDISDWNTAKVEHMGDMFYGATTFNQNIGSWDTGLVLYMQTMFYNATNFDQDISPWNTSTVEYMGNMFQNATAFNQDLSEWDVSSVCSYTSFSTGATSWEESKKPSFPSC